MFLGKNKKKSFAFLLVHNVHIHPILFSETQVFFLGPKSIFVTQFCFVEQTEGGLEYNDWIIWVYMDTILKVHLKYICMYRYITIWRFFNVQLPIKK